MNPYEKHFAKKTSPDNQKELDKINVFLKSLIERLNNKLDYNIAELASKAGIEISVAEQIAGNMIKKISGNSWKR
jgi:ribosomal protein S25